MATCRLYNSHESQTMVTAADGTTAFLPPRRITTVDEKFKGDLPEGVTLMDAPESQPVVNGQRVDPKKQEEEQAQPPKAEDAEPAAAPKGMQEQEPRPPEGRETAERPADEAPNPPSDSSGTTRARR